MLEYLRHLNEPFPERLLWAIMQKDMKLIDYQNSISALINTDKIKAVTLGPDNDRALIYNDAASRAVSGMDDEEFEELLQSGKEEEQNGRHKIH